MRYSLVLVLALSLQLSALSPAAAQSAAGAGWAAAIRPYLAGIGGPAAFAAANLARMDLSNPYAIQVAAPIGNLLAQKDISEEVFGKLPEAKRIALVKEALEAHVRTVGTRATGILQDAAAEAVSPEQIIDDARDAEDLLLFSHPFLREQAKEGLIAARPVLQGQALAYHQRLLTMRFERTATRLLADAEARAEDALGAKQTGQEAIDAALAPLPGAAAADAARDLLSVISEDALARIDADRRLSAKDKAERRLRWGEVTQAARASEGRSWVSEVQTLLAPLEAEYSAYLSGAWNEAVSNGKRAKPSGGYDALQELEILLTKGSPKPAAAPDDRATREELTRAAFGAFFQLKPLAQQYLAEDESLGTDAGWTRQSAWQTGAEPFVGYPTRQGSAVMGAQVAASVLKALRPRLKEFKAYVASDPLLAADAGARAALTANADALQGALSRLTK